VVTPGASLDEIVTWVREHVPANAQPSTS
jgi:hypothetical protein